VNREEAKELLPIIQGFSEGKDIQFKYRGGEWKDHGDVSAGFSNGDTEWRITPGVVVFWVNVSESGNITPHKTEDNAKTATLGAHSCYHIIARRVELQIGEGE